MKFPRHPHYFTADQIKAYSCEAHVGGGWYLARPRDCGRKWHWNRFVLAWKVLIGRCDALRWHKQ